MSATRKWKRYVLAASVVPLGGLTAMVGANAVPTPVVPGHPDAGFGVDGRIVLDLPDRLAASVGAVDAAPSVDGSTLVAVSHADGVTLSRYLLDGRVDPAFADDSTLWLSSLVTNARGLTPLVAPRPDGGAFVLVPPTYGKPEPRIVAVTADGAIDTTYGNAGEAHAHIGGGWPAAMALGPDGSIVFVGPDPAGWMSFGLITRMHPGGAVDVGFGANGTVAWYDENGAIGHAISDVEIGADGTITVLGRTVNAIGNGTLELGRYHPDGTPVEGWGADGTGVVTLFAGDVRDVGGLLPDGDGFVIGVARGASTATEATSAHVPAKAMVVRVGADGTVDETFGGPDGVGVVPVADGTVADLQRADDGSITVAVPVSVDGEVPGLTAVVRLDAADGSDLHTPWVPTLGGPAVGTELVGDDLLVIVRSTDRAYLVDTGSDAADPTAVELGVPTDAHEAAGGAVIRADGSSVVVGGVDGDALLVARAPDGGLDQSFGTDGVVRWRNGPADDLWLTDVVELADGRLLVAGVEDDRGVQVARLTADGELDPTFGEAGRAVTAPAMPDGTFGPSVAVDAHGRVLVTTENGVTRFLADGTPDEAFGTGGGSTTFADDVIVDDLAVLGDDAIVTAQRSRGIWTDGVVYRLTATGALDVDFGTDGVVVPVPRDQGSSVSGVAVDGPDGPIYVGGSRIVRLLDDGSPDPTFGTDGRTAGAAGQVAVTDRFVYGTTGRSDGSSELHRFDLNGQPDDRYGDYANPTTRWGIGGAALAVDSSDRALVVGADFDGDHRWTMESYRFVGGVLPPKPAVSIGDASVVEGTRPSGGGSPLVFPVTLSAASAVPVTVVVNRAAGSTADGDDGLPFHDARRSVLFAPGQTQASFTIAVTPDGVDEVDETIVYQIESVEYGVAGRARATGTIVDDDGPGAPANPSPGTTSAVTVTAGRNRITAAWAPPATPGASPVLRYTVMVVQNGAITGWVFVPGDARSASIDHLANDQVADVYVAAWTAGGIGPWSAVQRVTPRVAGPIVVPAAAPTLVSAVHEPGNRIRVGLGAPPADGGSPIVRYSVSAVDRATGQVAAWRNVPADVRSVTLTGLPTNRRYDVSVAAATSVGFGLATTRAATTSTSSTTSVLTAPGWEVATAGRRSVTATWAPAGEQGRVVGGYAVVVWQSGRIRSWQTVGADARTVTATGLLPGVAAEVVIVPFDTTGAYGNVAATHPRATPTA